MIHFLTFSVAAFELQWQGQVVERETVWPIKTKTVGTLPFTEKCCQSLTYGMAICVTTFFPPGNLTLPNNRQTTELCDWQREVNDGKWIF